ncbi:MAG: alkaline phosphatase, partial [Candidatus Neomarinimicrobiota bacterium]
MKILPHKIIVLLLLVDAVLHFTSCAADGPVPKNIIIMISDGGGFNHVDAASLYQYGETGRQVYEQFPVRLAMSTYLIDQPPYNPDSAWASFDYIKIKPTDSAASGTAIATGVKTSFTRLGVDSSLTAVTNITEQAEKIGKATGVVTSVPFNNATPAAFVAHSEVRYNYEQIARDMLAYSAVDVIMACGDARFDDDGKPVIDPDFT